MKVLLVEDDDHTRQALLEVLTCEGYCVLEATDGDAALEMFRRESPDFVCLDVMMPKLSGFEVCKKIKSDPNTKGIMVLMVTAPSVPAVFVSSGGGVVVPGSVLGSVPGSVVGSVLGSLVVGAV